MKKKSKIGYLFLLFLLTNLYFSCDDLEDKFSIEENTPDQEIGTAEMYILNEGLFNLNNSTLFCYNFSKKQTDRHFFKKVNKRGLGDTATDAAIYGSKVYIVVNVSSYVEVMDYLTGKSIKQIPFRQENGSSRQPRAITFHKEKAYVCSFDGSVARIDTTSLEIEKLARVGRNPDGICIQNNRLFISNSGGLDTDTQGVDNTVSVIDIPSFQEIQKIKVGPNPGKIQADTNGYVYVVTRGDNIEESAYRLHKIDAFNLTLTHTYDIPVLNFTIANNFAYAYSYNYQTQKSNFPLIDLESNKVIVPNFIKGTTIQTPYGITINPYSDNIYISDARDFQTEGDVFCFNQQGEFVYKIKNIGLNPNTILFSDIESQTEEEIPSSPIHKSFASKVLEYYPAPGQFINTTTSAYKEGYSKEQVLSFANEKIKKRSLFTLGAYGGYITLGFDEAIPNIKGEYDFKIYGNAFYSNHPTITAITGSSEPGIVLVSKDINNNGLPDDEWYELAGSEYHAEETIHNYEITYSKPLSNGDIPWIDNQGNNGLIKNILSNNKKSYYPNWAETEQLTFKGSRLANNTKEINGLQVGFCFPWGYADNHPNNSELSNFKIDWAVDKDGKPVDLDKIDFVKVYTGVNQNAGLMGELSTEIETIENLHYKH